MDKYLGKKLEGRYEVMEIIGIGGMAIVYVLVPFLDGLFRKLPVRALIITACILSAAFAVDQVYSLKYPNEGKGITDFQEVTVSGTAVNIFDS